MMVGRGDTSKRNLGFAFDIGTTTICGQLINLNTKRYSAPKPPIINRPLTAPDVITRIIFAQGADGLEQLHRAVIGEMNLMIQELPRENNIDLNGVTCCLCAGNTTMMHLLLRVDPTYIRREPYVPTSKLYSGGQGL